MKYKAIFFDLDGVLTTNHSGGGQMCKHLAQTLEVDVETIREIYKPFGKELGLGRANYAQVIEALNNALGTEVTMENVQDAFLSAPKNVEMFTLAESLRSKGYVLGVITDNDKERFATLKVHLGLEDLFDHLVLSANIGAFKHSEVIFKEALRLAGVKPEEAVFIDNKQANLEAAQELGMKTIWFDDSKNDVKGLEMNLSELIGQSYVQ